MDGQTAGKDCDSFCFCQIQKEYLQLTARVESMESVLEDIQEYIEKVTVNSTDKHLIIDRMDPGNVVIVKYNY